VLMVVVLLPLLLAHDHVSSASASKLCSELDWTGVSERV
jgi:hypothetical protein